MKNQSFPRDARGALRSALISTVALVANALFAQPPEGIRLPAVATQGGAHGAAAIEALGEHLPAVAKAYGLNAQDLATLLRVQPSMGVDVSGALLFACDGLKVDNARVSDGLTATSSTMQIASGSTVDVFQLHSLPGASRVIYLDFTGHVTSGTSWNTSYTGGADIVSQPFDLDGDTTTFNDTERAMIMGIWKRVSEDYAPFAVDVTTQDPGIEALRKTTSSDNAFGIRVVISQTNWYSTNAGGTAYVGSFNWNSDTPCWVFAAQLANGEKYIAEAISHEVGHTMGLYHDGVGGTSPTEYYYGQGDWAPIMGCGYYKGITQFSKGEYANANNTQDDISVISTYAPLIGDDHGNTLAAATVLSGPSIAGGGTIETRSDVDVFRFDTGEGAIALTVASPAGEADLSAKVELLDASGAVLANNSSMAVSAAFNLSVPAGTYYLRISAIGSGDPATTGYSTYGSLGNYVIVGNVVGIAGKQAPVAKVSASTTTGTASLAVNFSGQGSADSDGSIVGYAWDFGNGTTGSGLTAGCTYSAAGTYIAVLTVTDNDGLVGSASVTITVSAPANIAPTAVASASTTSGLAPLAIAFSSAGSNDADGSIASYLWTFGDGTTSTVASPAKTFSTAGNYSVVLKVTDNSGASATSTVAVSIAADPNADVDVQSYVMTKSTTNAGSAAVATIVVMNRAGQAVSGVSVTVQWSGLVSGSSTGKTDASGKVSLVSGRSKKAGTITGTITVVTPAAGSKYDTSIYSAATVASIKN
jgi:PKD repeat protein